MLRSLGLSVFRDETGLSFYDKLDAKLKSEIAKSKRLLAVVSPEYLRSYWCLFEALEAIEGSDLEARFLPLVVQYHPDDQTLSEDFVFDALRDLREQSRIVEAKIIEARAFGLSEKLDKLAFVQRNIPRIFNLIRERIYPEFNLWDKAKLEETSTKLATVLAPDKTLEWDQNWFVGVKHHEQAEKVVPRLQMLPQLVWSADVGCQAWRNTPVVLGNDIFVASSGNVWNAPDDQDGVFSLSAETGSQKWFAPMPHDANAMLLSKGWILVGCDDGTIACLKQATGEEVWSTRLPSAAIGGPFKLRANIGAGLASGADYHKSEDACVVVTYEGYIQVFDIETGSTISEYDIGKAVIGKPELSRERFHDVLYLPCADGTIGGLTFNTIRPGSAQKKFSVMLDYKDEHAESGRSMASLSARPIVDNGVIYQGIARQTEYSEAPVVALDSNDGRVLWADTGLKEDRSNYGNLRTEPVIYGDALIFAPAYSNSVEAISRLDGAHLWSVQTSQGMFEQWSSPVILGTSLFIGRHDGYLHKIDLEQRRLVWSIFLGNEDGAGTVVDGSQSISEFDDTFAWSSSKASPILSTPIADRGRLYVGTHSGKIYCIGNLGD